MRSPGAWPAADAATVTRRARPSCTLGAAKAEKHRVRRDSLQLGHLHSREHVRSVRRPRAALLPRGSERQSPRNPPVCTHDTAALPKSAAPENHLGCLENWNVTTTSVTLWSWGPGAFRGRDPTPQSRCFSGTARSPWGQDVRVPWGGMKQTWPQGVRSTPNPRWDLWASMLQARTPHTLLLTRRRQA